VTLPSEPGATVRVLLPLVDGVEEMEAVICIDLFRRAGWLVCAAGAGADSVCASRGVGLLVDADLDAALTEDWDLICIPGGGLGVDALLASEILLQFVQRQWFKGGWVAAICAGPLVLDRAGVLTNCSFTCHPAVADRFEGRMVSTDPVVVDGRLVTSRGPGTAMLFALTLIELIEGPEAVDAVRGPLCIP